MRSPIDSQLARRVVIWGIMALIVVGALFDFATGTLAAFGLGMLRFICPVGFLEISLATRSIVWEALPYTLIALGAIFLIGRFPCGWLCPMYKFKHWLGRVVPIRRLQAASDRLPIHVTWRDGLAVLGGVLAVSAITGYPVYCIVCPIGIISRNLISLGTHLTVHPDILLLPFYPLVLGIFVDWQRVCPVGNIGGLANQRAPLRTPRPDRDVCVRCHTCTEACPEDIDLWDPDVDMGACTQCLKCTGSCPEGAISVVRAVSEDRSLRAD